MIDIGWLERKKYRAIWKHENYRKHSPAMRHYDAIAEMLKPSSTVIDFGIGTGRLADLLIKQGHTVQGVDITSNCLNDEFKHIPLTVCPLWELEDLNADYGVCCDVMEHIPTEKAEQTIQCIYQSINKSCFFSISTVDDTMGDMLIGDKLHLTVKPADWWIDILADAFSSVTTLKYENEIIAFCEKE